MITNWKTQLSNKNKFGVFIMDLSKASGTLNHKILIAELEGYSLISRSSSFLQSYLSKQYQPTKHETLLVTGKVICRSVTTLDLL